MRLSALHREFRHYALAERGLKLHTVRDILAIVARLCSFSETEDVTGLNTPEIRAFLCDGKVEKGWAARTFLLYRQYLKPIFDSSRPSLEIRCPCFAGLRR